MSQSDPWDTQIFSAELRPYRSLGRAQFQYLMLFFFAAMFFISIPFFMLGAWPVLGFMGLDVVGFWWAFKVNYRDARAIESIKVTPLELAIDRISPKGARSEWRFNPMWVQVQKQEHEEYGLEKLLIVSHGRVLEVAGFLGPDQKARFASDFIRALGEAKRGPVLN